jgi:hypothetical protein
VLLHDLPVTLDKACGPLPHVKSVAADASADAVERATACSTAIERRFNLRVQEDEMNMPSFTAEASLYKTSEHYSAVPYNPSAQSVSPVWPAAEVIEIHDCAPGFIKLGEGPNTICFPDPNLTGGDDQGEGSPGNGGPTQGGDKGGPQPRKCIASDFSSAEREGLARQACLNKFGNNAYLWCIPQGFGRPTAHCCVKKANGRTACVPVSSLPPVPGTTAVSHGSAL